MLLELPGCQILLFKLVKTTHATGLIPKYAALSRTKNVTIDLFTTVSKASTSCYFSHIPFPLCMPKFSYMVL